MVGMAVLQKDTQLAGVLREDISDLQARLPCQLHAKGNAAANKSHQTRDNTWNHLKILKQTMAKAVEAIRGLACVQKSEAQENHYTFINQTCDLKQLN